MSKEDDCRPFFGAFSNKPLQQDHGTNGKVIAVPVAAESDLDFQKAGTATTLVSPGTREKVPRTGTTRN
jgi:hypothetical protein